MNKYMSLFKNKKVLITSLMMCLLSIGVCFAFNNLVSESYSGLRTWRNIDSTYVAYDSRKFEENCFVYYGKNLSFNVEREKESIKLPSYCYQYIRDVEYNSKSILNEKNVIKGVYSRLSGREIAIPESISSHYKKTIGDYFYLNGNIEYTIKYITVDFYSIHDASINSDASSIFVGSSNELLGVKESYAVFDNISRDYNQVFSFKHITDNFRNSFIIGMSSFSLIIIGILTFNLLFYKKEKLATLNESSLCGKKSLVIKDLLVMNVSTIIIPFVAPAVLFFFLKNYWLSGILACLVLVFFVIDSIVLRKKVR